MRDERRVEGKAGRLQRRAIGIEPGQGIAEVRHGIDERDAAMAAPGKAGDRMADHLLVVGIDIGVRGVADRRAVGDEGKIRLLHDAHARIVRPRAGNDDAVGLLQGDDLADRFKTLLEIAHGIERDAVGALLQRPGDAGEKLGVFHAFPFVLPRAGRGHDGGDLIGLAGAKLHAVHVELVTDARGGGDDDGARFRPHLRTVVQRLRHGGDRKARFLRDGLDRRSRH